MFKYHVAINPAIKADGTEESITVDIVTLQGTKKRRKKDWRNYLRVRLGTNDIHKMNKVTKALGFTELL